MPSPAVAAYGFECEIPSLMVTGSHIPDDRNGIKLNRVDGEVLKQDEMAMCAQEVMLPELFDAAGMLKEVRNRCTRPTYSESLLMVRLARDDEEIGQCRVRLMQGQTAV